jgi:hypothetical protein
MRELLIGQTMGGNPLDRLEERGVREVRGSPPHRREQLAHEIREPLRPGLGRGVGNVSEARHGANGIQRERERHGCVFYRTRQRREGHTRQPAR